MCWPNLKFIALPVPKIIAIGVLVEGEAVAVIAVDCYAAANYL